MANVTFNLKRPLKNPALIYAKFFFNYYEIDENGKKKYIFLKISTRETINPKYWDYETQRGITTNKFKEYPEFNTRLDNLETAIKNIYRQMLNDKEPLTPETLKEKINDYLAKNRMIVQPEKQPKGLTAFIKTVIDETKRGERTTKDGKQFQPRTLLSYNTTLNNLKEYQTSINKTLKFSDINLKFYNKYVKYLNDNGFAVNTIGGHIKNIKVFMKIATKRGLNDTLDFGDTDFRKIEEEVENIYLNETELQKIYNKDLSKNKKLLHVRDMFIIGCYTGLRYSDLKQLRKEHFNDNTIKIEIKKTGETVVIPLHWTVKEIFEKYEYNLPRVISNQKFNKYLKDIGDKSEIKETVVVTETKGGLKVEKNQPKYKLISVHTARRSFATNSYLAGIPTISIMKITGHKTERAFLKYIKISGEENAKLMLQHPFFSQSHLKIV